MANTFFFQKHLSDNTFSMKQLNEINMAMENGLPNDKINIFAKPEFSAEIMKVAKDAFYDGIDAKFLTLVLQSNKEATLIKSELQLYHLNLTNKELSNILKEGYNADQIDAITKTVLNEKTKISFAHLQQYLAPWMTKEQIYLLTQEITKKRSDIELLALFKKERSFDEMKSISEMKCFKKEFIKDIDSIPTGLSNSDIKLYDIYLEKVGPNAAEPIDLENLLNPKNPMEYKTYYVNNMLSLNNAQKQYLFKENSWDMNQLMSLNKAMKDISVHILKKYIDPSYTPKQIELFATSVSKEYPDYVIQACLDKHMKGNSEFNKDYNDSKLSILMKGHEKGISEREFKLLKDSAIPEENLKTLLNEISSFTKKSKKEIEQSSNPNKKPERIPVSLIKCLTSPKLLPEQISSIVDTYQETKLPIPYLKKFMDADLNADEMKETSKYVQAKLSNELKDLSFTEAQKNEIKIALSHGITKTQVLDSFTPKSELKEMKKIRLELQKEPAKKEPFFERIRNRNKEISNENSQANQLFLSQIDKLYQDSYARNYINFVIENKEALISPILEEKRMDEVRRKLNKELISQEIVDKANTPIGIGQQKDYYYYDR